VPVEDLLFVSPTVASIHYVVIELQNRLHGHLRLQVELAKLSQRYRTALHRDASPSGSLAHLLALCCDSSARAGLVSRWWETARLPSRSAPDLHGKLHACRVSCVSCVRCAESSPTINCSHLRIGGDYPRPYASIHITHIEGHLPASLAARLQVRHHFTKSN
jgi:hypothetical protein